MAEKNSCEKWVPDTRLQRESISNSVVYIRAWARCRVAYVFSRGVVPKCSGRGRLIPGLNWDVCGGAIDDGFASFRHPSMVFQNRCHRYFRMFSDTQPWSTNIDGKHTTKFMSAYSLANKIKSRLIDLGCAPLLPNNLVRYQLMDPQISTPLNPVPTETKVTGRCSPYVCWSQTKNLLPCTHLLLTYTTRRHWRSSSIPRSARRRSTRGLLLVHHRQ